MARRAGLAWDAEDDGKLLLMAEAGFTIGSAAEKLERTTRSVKLRYCKLRGIKADEVRYLSPHIHLTSLDVLRPGRSNASPLRKILRAARP